MQMLEIGIVLLVALLIYGIIHIIYNEFYNVQQSKHARQKKGGIWYYVVYLNPKYPNCDIGNVTIYQWSRSDKPIGKFFEVLKTENYKTQCTNTSTKD